MKKHVDFRYMPLFAGIAAAGMSQHATADTIDPASFAQSLAVGESATVRKTVTISEGAPSDALLDVMFLIDTTGSMSGEIAAAKTAASDILAGLSSFSGGGNLRSGLGYYNDVPPAPGFDGVDSDLADDATTISALEAYDIGYPDGGGGGDSPELGNSAVKDAADNASWRAGSSRFAIALGDASFKDGGTETQSDADVIASLEAANVSLLGLDFSGGFGLTSSVEELGGTAYDATTDPATIIEAITTGVELGFAEYGEVTIGDLGNATDAFDIAVTCVSADTGTCDGDRAIGDFDRSAERSFVFDVMFTRTGAALDVFDTYALVDGSIVATERDDFGAGETGGGESGGEEPGSGEVPAPIPLPASAWLLAMAVGGLGALRRRRA